MRNNPCRPRHVALDRIVAHFRMRDNHRVISSFTYCYRLFSMLKRKNFRRAKVNCICRCTPQGEVMMLNYKFISQAVDDALHLIANCRSTGVIAATAVRTGRLCETTGHDPLALNIYKTAISAITSIDRDRAELYYDFGPHPQTPHYRYWSARVNDADALEVAKRLDNLYLRMGFRGLAHQQRRINWSYNVLFRSVYSACM